jgi:hypothetical protein
MIETHTSALRLGVSLQKFAVQVFSLFILPGTVDTLSDHWEVLSQCRRRVAVSSFRNFRPVDIPI